MAVKELDILLDLNKSGKKLNQENQGHYRKVLFDTLVEKQVPCELSHYIVNGAAIGGAKAFCEYVMKYSDAQEEQILSILRSKDFVELRATFKYRFILLLLAEFIKTHSKYDEVYGILLNWLPSTAKKKNGEYISELSSCFKMFFLDEISMETKMPNVEALGLPEAVVKEITTVISLALSNLSVKKTEEIAKKKVLEKWIAQYSPSEIVKEPSMAVNGDETISVEEVPSKSKSRKAQLLIELAQEWALLEKTNIDLAQKVDQQSRELSDLQKHATALELQFVTATDTTNDLMQQLINLKNENDSLKQVIIDLESRITRQSSVLSVYSEDKENSKFEQLNAIASALVRSYKEYKEVTTMNLITDMEMNLLDLLEDIFRKLKKCGIDIEGRL